jgi:hypothetical protein
LNVVDVLPVEGVVQTMYIHVSKCKKDKMKVKKE